MFINYALLGYVVRKARKQEHKTVEEFAKMARIENKSVLTKIEYGTTTNPTSNTLLPLLKCLSETNYMRDHDFNKDVIIDSFCREKGMQREAVEGLDDTINLLAVFNGFDEGYERYKAHSYAANVNDIKDYIKEVFGEEGGSIKELDDNVLDAMRWYMHFIKFKRDLKEKAEICRNRLICQGALKNDGSNLKLGTVFSLADCFNDKCDGQKKYNNAFMKMLQTPDAENAYEFITMILEEISRQDDLITEEQDDLVTEPKLEEEMDDLLQKEE